MIINLEDGPELFYPIRFGVVNNKNFRNDILEETFTTPTAAYFIKMGGLCAMNHKDHAVELLSIIIPILMVVLVISICCCFYKKK